MGRILAVIGVLVLIALAAGTLWFQNASKGVDPAGLESSYMAGTDRLLEVAGTTIRIREEGPSDGPVIILLHGFTFSLESFDAWAAELSKTHRVIRYDLLGHGLTGPDPQKRYAPSERAAFLGEVMDALGIEKASIAGNSLGGLIGWKFAAANPDKVEKLILISAAAYSINGVTDEPVPVPPGMKAFFLTVPEAGIQATVNLVYADPGKVSEERIAILGDMMRREGNGQAFIEHLEEFVLPDPTAELQKITAPTLILWGGKDQMIPAEQADRLYQDIPNATTIIYETLGHVAHEEDPEATLRDTVAFLNR